MTTTFNPDAAANKQQADAFDPMAQLNALKFDDTMPETWRSLAGTAVDQSRQAYEQAKVTLEAGLQAMERSYDAAGHAAAALNRKIIDIAQRNINSGFDLAKSLAAAKNLAEVVELQGAYWRKQFETLLEQAEEVRSLSLKTTSAVTEPITRHAAREAERAQAISKKVTAETASAIRQQVTKLEEELRRAS
jgi:phasin